MNLSQWVFVTTRKPDASARLFCFPHAGVGSSAYRGWADASSPELEICTIQLPGRESRLREPALDSLDIVVRNSADAVERLADRPFAFFGHSMGAIVAFETARELRRRGTLRPLSLCVSASRAPQLPWPHPPVRHLEDLALLTELNRRYESVPDVILADEELRQLLTPALRCDMSMVETYNYVTEAPLDVPVLAFGGADDRMVRRPELEQWREQTTGSFQLRMMPGGHLFLHAKRSELLADVESALGLSHNRLAGRSATRAVRENSSLSEL